MIDRFFINISNFNRESLTEMQNIQVGKNIIFAYDNLGDVCFKDLLLSMYRHVSACGLGM